MARQDRSAFGRFTIVSLSDTDADEFAFGFDSTESESFSAPQDVPTHAVANGQKNDTVISNQETFEASFSMTETPFEFDDDLWTRLVKSTLPWVGACYPEGGSGGFKRTHGFFLRLLDERKRTWRLYTTRHGILDSYKISDISTSASSSVTGLKIKVSFKKYNVTESASETLPTIPVAKKAATPYVAPSEVCFDDDEVPVPLDEDTSVLYAENHAPGGSDNVSENAYKALPEEGAVGTVFGIQLGLE